MLLQVMVTLTGAIQRTSKRLATASERFLAPAPCTTVLLTAAGVRTCTMGSVAAGGSAPLVFLPVGVADAERLHKPGGELRQQEGISPLLFPGVAG